MRVLWFLFFLAALFGVVDVTCTPACSTSTPTAKAVEWLLALPLSVGACLRGLWATGRDAGAWIKDC